MKKTISIILFISLLLSVSICFASESEGDMYTFCPEMSTSLYNEILKGYLELNDTQAAFLQVSSGGKTNGKYTYSTLLKDTMFLFEGASSTYDIGDTAFIWCSLKDSSILKNIPMIIWAGCIQMKYYGSVSDTGSSFLEWVNNGPKDGDQFTSPYFIAHYSETPYEECSLLLIKI